MFCALFSRTMRQRELRRWCFYIPTRGERDPKGSAWGSSSCKRERRQGRTLDGGPLPAGLCSGHFAHVIHLKNARSLWGGGIIILILHMKTLRLDIQVHTPSTTAVSTWIDQSSLSLYQLEKLKFFLWSTAILQSLKILSCLLVSGSCLASNIS